MLCRCGSKKLYAECCGPYHEGQEVPTALALMRSRYCAYALGLVDYILETSLPPPLKKDIESFCKETVFKGLEILEATENTVTFRVSISQEGKDFSYVEKSYFKKVGDQWKYLAS